MKLVTSAPVITMMRVTVQFSLCCAVLLLGFAIPAIAGPPYLTDDPEPTDYRHFEIYTFSQGTAMQDGIGGEGGIDFNYGGAPNLQLTANEHHSSHGCGRSARASQHNCRRWAGKLHRSRNSQPSHIKRETARCAAIAPFKSSSISRSLLMSKPHHQPVRTRNVADV
jgi:hypothetical protein